MNKGKILRYACLFLFLFFINCEGRGQTTEVDKKPFETPEGTITVTFSVTADVLNYTGENHNYFRGVCERIKYGGKGDFMVSAGDIKPPAGVYSTIKTFISKDYPWYPVAGNHEIDSEPSITWLREYNENGNTLPHVVQTGPPGTEETTYSFNYENAHFVILNQYYDGTSDTATDGDITDPLYNWLEKDLKENTKPVVFVFGHEPAYPQPDKENGRKRHELDSLNKYPENRDRFWELLAASGIAAYVCGHTHGYSTYTHDEVLQVDAGHARGTGDKGAKSTFLMFYILEDATAWLYTYRLSSGSYPLYEKIQIR